MKFYDFQRGRNPRAMRRYHENRENDYESFDATALYCPKCKNPMPVRKKLLLILPKGNLFSLVCVSCGSVLGKKTE